MVSTALSSVGAQHFLSKRGAYEEARRKYDDECNANANCDDPDVVTVVEEKLARKAADLREVRWHVSMV